MAKKNEVDFSKTKVAQALLEIAGDRLEGVIKHCKDVNSLEGKPCEITVKLTVVPNARRDQFGLLVTGSTKFSGKQSAESTLFADVDGEEVSLMEFNPAQATIDDAISDANKTRSEHA